MKSLGNDPDIPGILLKLGAIWLILVCLAGVKSVDAAGKVDINTAGTKELQSLPYIGNLRAKAIIQSREIVGRFTRAEELVERKLIGRETLEAIQFYITLASSHEVETEEPITITNIHIDGSRGNVFFLDNKNFIRLLTAKINQSQVSIQIAMYLFKISDNPYNFASRLCEQIILARKRGVKVEVILEYSDFNFTLNESNRQTMEKLKRNGIRVRFDSEKQQTHAKLVIIDGTYTFIGSHNFSHSALVRNNEISLMIESAEIAEKAGAYFLAIE